MKRELEIFDFGAERHKCDASKEGDWVVYRCQTCDYVRRAHLKTGEMKCKGGDPMALHSGDYKDPVLLAHDLLMN